MIRITSGSTQAGVIAKNALPLDDLPKWARPNGEHDQIPNLKDREEIDQARTMRRECPEERCRAQKEA